jgi:urease accessory protein
VTPPGIAGRPGAVDADAAVAVDAAGRLSTLRSAGPLQLRPGRVGEPIVRLVTGAGGPLVGDSWCLRLDVARGAELVLRAVAASVALPAADADPGSFSRFEIHARVARGGWLDVDLGPTVAAAGARHRVAVTLDVEEGGGARWHEELVIGRHGERGGRLIATQDICLAGRPLLRQELRLGEPSSSSSATTAGARVVASELLVGARAGEDGGTAVALHPVAPAARLPLAGSGWHATALADDVPTARRRLVAVLPVRPGHPLT